MRKINHRDWKWSVSVFEQRTRRWGCRRNPFLMQQTYSFIWRDWCVWRWNTPFGGTSHRSLIIGGLKLFLAKCRQLLNWWLKEKRNQCALWVHCEASSSKSFRIYCWRPVIPRLDSNFSLINSLPGTSSLCRWRSNVFWSANCIRSLLRRGL